VAKRLRLLLIGALALAALSSATGSAQADLRINIGHSVKDRPIVAFRSGPRLAPLEVVVVGAIHGDETAGMRIARRLIQAPPIPGVRLFVVPTINPDGVAAGTRGNPHGVDLNRNFPYRWQPLDGGEYSGPRPLSEPEARAAYGFIYLIRPDVTIWFHQPFGLIDRPTGNPFAARRFSQLIDLPLHRLPGLYPGSASRWQTHIFPWSTAFVAELPAQVSTPLIERATAAVRTLAAELASPEIADSHRTPG
jgi:murein peptide amidase A